MKTNYNIGLDIGTSSVGWSVVDTENYKVMRKGNKALWGVRLFEEAKSAESRRIARGSRRRYERRRKRIRLLQEIFKPEIEKVDSLFFKRMKESFFSQNDKVNRTIFLTKEDKINLSKYNKKYPTIYHLRNAVMTGTETDIRLVYLAIHHIIKYRGNFLYEGDFKVKNLDISSKIRNIFELLEEFNILEFINIEFLNEKELENAFKEQSKQDRQLKIKEVLNEVVPKNFIAEFTKAILGNTYSVCKLFNIENDEDIKITFKGTKFEDSYDDTEKLIGDNIEILDCMKELYDMLFLSELFKGRENASISELMIGRYNQHKEDLKFLKDLLKQDKKEYHKIFKTRKNAKELCLYEQYINNQKTLDDFQKEIKNSVISIYGKEIYENNYKQRIESDDFLPRITDSDNGKYPYQLNKEELLQMIKVQGQNYPFLLEKINTNNQNTKDDDYKLIKILSFRIPYYVGPLNTTTSSRLMNKNAWIEYREGYSPNNINPYNFDQAIDLDTSAEKFIKRMISKCTYLLQKDAMPASSILYSKFKVLNELKQISINDNRIDHDFQMKIYHELFLKEGNITEKKFVDYLKRQPEVSMYNEFNIKGYSADKKFANNMQSYIDFFGSNGILIDTPYTIDDAEKIIEWSTIFEDKSILERKIRQNYPKIPEVKIKKCINKRYKGWSSLSKELLTELKTDDGKSIMDLMEEKSSNPEKQNQNFMQILNDKDYKFQEQIDQINGSIVTEKLNYQVVDKLATSPATKRGIYQALKIVEELVHYIGYAPVNIYIEMSRGDDKKKQRKDNRKKRLMNLYEKYKKDIDDFDRLKRKLNEMEESNFKDEKIFLYFIQQGKSLYTGKPIDIEHLEECEVDHIIPRTLIKDDSIDNKALVLREENQIKAANFVLPDNYRTSERIKWWNILLKQELISKKKFNALKRREYSEKDIEGFINRQLVETRQITKHVANILQNYYKDSKVIYLNANLSHNYREKFELFKFRELNDYHHAHDAYLAAVLGYYQKNIFKQSIDIDLIKEQTKELYNNKEYKELGYGLIINSMNNKYLKHDLTTGEIKTSFDADQFNELVCNTLYRNDILISKKTEIRTGEFYNQTKNQHGKKGVPLKKQLPTNIYGSYTSLNPAYALVVKYTKKGKENQKMIGMPIYYVHQSKQMQLNYMKELLELNDLDNIEIIKDKIPFYTLLDWNDQICMLVGATDKVEVCNAKEFQIDKSNMMKWKYTLKRLFSSKCNYIIDDTIYESQLSEIIIYIIDKVEKEYQLYKNLIEDMKKYFCYENPSVLTLEQKEKIIIEMLKLLKYDSQVANLKFLDKSYSMAFGKKNDRIIETFKIINLSITGLYKRYNEF